VEQSRARAPCGRQGSRRGRAATTPPPLTLHSQPTCSRPLCSTAQRSRCVFVSR
jgi:hypothetical protein